MQRDREADWLSLDAWQTRDRIAIPPGFARFRSRRFHKHSELHIPTSTPFRRNPRPQHEASRWAADNDLSISSQFQSCNFPHCKPRSLKRGCAIRDSIRNICTAYPRVVKCERQWQPVRMHSCSIDLGSSHCNSCRRQVANDFDRIHEE